MINNKARHNQIYVKYCQMVFGSVGGAVVFGFLGTPWLNESDAQPPDGDYMKFVV